MQSNRMGRHSGLSSFYRYLYDTKAFLSFFPLSLLFFALFFALSFFFFLKMSRSARIYVGNLPLDVREREIEDIFDRYGRIGIIYFWIWAKSLYTTFIHLHFSPYPPFPLSPSPFEKQEKIDLKIPPRPPAFAFVEFRDSRDADDAVREKDGELFFFLCKPCFFSFLSLQTLIYLSLL